MELKEGMYVRTKYNGICKLYREFYEDSVDVGISVFPEIEGFFIDEEEINYIEKRDIIKASYNIIDLIEVGDYVNGFRMEQITEFKDGSRYLEFDDGKYYCKNYQIQSIVTKEQFESMSYKVGGNE